MRRIVIFVLSCGILVHPSERKSSYGFRFEDPRDDSHHRGN